MTIEDGEKEEDIFFINESEINNETKDYYNHFWQNLERSFGCNLTYILDGNNNPVAEPNPIKHGMFMSDFDRRQLGFDELNGITISTVFLGINYQYGDGPPILFETMVFGMTEHDSYQERYETYDEALAGHAKAVKIVKMDFGN